jgi:peroxin-6
MSHPPPPLLENRTNQITRFTLSPSLSLPRIASHLPFTYTGADFYALCSDAMLKAVTRQAFIVDAKIATINKTNLSSGKTKISTAYFFDHFATKEDVAVLVEEEDFIAAERELVPSVSAKELEHYSKVRQQFEKVEDKPSKSQVGNEEKGKGKAIAKPDGIPEWQQGDRPRSSGKGKGKEKVVVDRKSKGKDRAVGRWDEGSEGEDEDGQFFDERVNGFGGKSKGKGKGKEIDMGFRERVEDDDGLY